MVVFADSKKDRSLLPPGVSDVRSEAGNTIPMVFVTTANGEKGIKGIPYADLKGNMRKSIRELKNTLASASVVGKPSDGAETGLAEESSTGLLAKEQAWTNAEGKTITAAIRKVEGDQVHFILKNGKAAKYDLSKLSQESQDKIAKLTDPS